MASALSFLVNDNPVQNVAMLDAFTNCYVFEHKMAKHYKLLEANSTEMIIDNRYDYRPDLISYEVYGSNFWYPAILTANKLGSFLQFRADYLDSRCLVPNADIITEILKG